MNESSKVPLEDPQGKLKAYSYARERSQSGIGHGANFDRERWGAWVDPWLRDRYRNQPKTLLSYLGAWKQLAFFFAEQKIACPRLLTYQHAVDFAHWREAQVKKRSKKKVSRNTALHNLTVLSRVMREAIRRGFAISNPCAKMGEDLPSDPAPKKPEFTAEQIDAVRKELRKRRAKWMLAAFEIDLHQGCRLSATSIPFDRIDFERNTITFFEKGARGRKAVFTTAMHPGIRGLLLRIKSTGAKETLILPRFASRCFARVMQKLGLPHTFHCTRVTVITQLARSGVPVQQAMSFVHHGDWAIHRIYQRLAAPDMGACIDALKFEPGAAPKHGAPQIAGASRSTEKPLPESIAGR